MKYVAFYDLPEYVHEKRYVNMAAAQVIAYMINAFSSFESVEVIAPSRTTHAKGFFKGRTTKINENAKIILPATFGCSNVFTRVLSQLWTQIWLFWYLLIHSKNGEKIVFYHSLSTMKTIQWLVRIKRIKPILEFREIYSDINHVSAFTERTERRFHTCAHGYIFPSNSLRDLLQIENKPCVLAPGSYIVHCENSEKFNDGKTHLVYAGNLRMDKGGAYVAIECGKQLNNNFVVHILGRDNKESVDQLVSTINLAKETCCAEIIYEGYKTGDDLYHFIAKCDIGLATQSPGTFNNSSFPSKILIYLGCGLPVIAPDIDAVKKSPIHNFIKYYDNNDLSSLKNAVEDIKEYPDIQKEIRHLDFELKKQLKTLLF